jgi:hypothetical protein
MVARCSAGCTPCPAPPSLSHRPSITRRVLKTSIALAVLTPSVVSMNASCSGTAHASSQARLRPHQPGQSRRMACAPTCPTGTASTGQPRCGNDIAQTTVSEPSPGADAAEPSPHIWQRWVWPIDTQAMRALERTPVVTQRLQRHGRLPREPAGPDRPERNLHVDPTRSARVVVCGRDFA